MMRRNYVSLCVLAGILLAAPDATANDFTVLQQFLNDRGCNAGTADGVWGRNSQAALDRFEFDTGLSVDQAATPQVLTAIAADATCIDHFAPLDLDEKLALAMANPALKLLCSGSGGTVRTLPLVGDVTMADGATGIVSSDLLGDVASSFARAGLSCWSGDKGSCDAVIHSLSEYATEGGISYSGKLGESSSQFTDTRLEVNLLLTKMLGAYLVARKASAGPADISLIEGWLAGRVALFDKPAEYFQDNHLTTRAQVNALMYLITQDGEYRDYARRQWDASMAGVRTDGSLPMEAQRGASAVHYTGTEIGLLIGLAEIMNMAGDNFYALPNVSKLHDAVAFHLDALENWDAIFGYARANRAGITSNWKVQDFRYSYLWAPVYGAYMARFPAHANTQRMRELMLDPRTCEQDPEGRPAACRGSEKQISLIKLLTEFGNPDQSFLHGRCIYPAPQ